MTRFEHVYVLNVMSDDHPGIVAAVTGAVESLGGNIDACSQTVLDGYFTLIMIVSVPQPIDADLLVERVQSVEAAGSKFQVLARPVRPQADTAPHELSERFVITAFGRDQPGIVRRFSQYLAGKDINIVDLFGDRSGEDFVLIGQVQVPIHWDIRMMQADLEQMGNELGFTVKLQHENIFVATNQLRLTPSPSREPRNEQTQRAPIRTERRRPLPPRLPRRPRRQKNTGCPQKNTSCDQGQRFARRSSRWSSPLSWRSLLRTYEAEAYVIPTGSMAPTLMGRHKDLTCPRCGYAYQVGASEEVDSRSEASKGRDHEITRSTCPMCRYTMNLEADNPQRKSYPSFKGDRVMVDRLSHQFSDLKRWDIVVFKCPREAETPYVKRLIGLPGETIRIRHGDILGP